MSDSEGSEEWKTVSSKKTSRPLPSRRGFGGSNNAMRRFPRPPPAPRRFTSEQNKDPLPTRVLSKTSARPSLATSGVSQGGVRKDPEEEEEEGEEGEEDEDEDEEEEGIEPPPEAFDAPVLVFCPFEHSQEQAATLHAFTYPRPLIEHLERVHLWRFRNLHHMHGGLQKYLDFWAKAAKEKGEGLDGVKEELDEKGKVLLRIVDPEHCREDLELRKKLQAEKLSEILRLQEEERHTTALMPRKCLFCRHVQENRAVLFRHMYLEHNFNIGLPDNLVEVEEFLAILEGKLTKLQCLYCEKTFTAPTVLRKHMRKKKHFKISPRNRLYDRFYVVNYLEPGKNWEDWEAEAYDSEEEETPEDPWDDWEGSEQEELTTQCLFDEVIGPNPEAIIEHMKSVHQFDLVLIKKNLGLTFYQTISLINFIRNYSLQLKCFDHPDLGEFTDYPSLLRHQSEQGCIHRLSLGLNEASSSPQFLFPKVENDPMLMWVDLDEAEAQEDPEERRAAAREVLGKLTIEMNQTGPDGSRKS